jgi:hypothetical protein
MPVPRQVIQRTMEIGPRMSGLPKAPVTCSAKLRGSLDRHLPPARTTEDDMHAMRRAAWRSRASSCSGPTISRMIGPASR